MDIELLFAKFNNKEQKDQPEEKVLSDNEKAKEKFIGILGLLVNKSIIDMSEYAYLINFCKNDTLTNLQKFHEYIEKINKSQLDEKIKEDMNTNIEIAFKHLYDLYDASQKGSDAIKINDVIRDIQLYNQDTIVFTEDQISAIKNICHFLYDSNMKTFGLYGFAGTGKTTIITKLIHYLLSRNYIKTVVFSAPTNKAVNVIKSKFKNDLSNLIKMKTNAKKEEDLSFNDLLDKLDEKGFKVTFMTIHKLLDFQNEFDTEGDRVFIRGNKSTIAEYDLVIIDECSMIPFQIIYSIFDEVKKKEILSKKIPKVLFAGDPAQLPPVNEKISAIFAQNINEIKFDMIKTDKDENIDTYVKPNVEFIKKQFETIRNDIVAQKSVTMEKIVRNSDTKVTGLSNEIRRWILNNKIPKLAQYKGPKVFLYKYEPKDKDKNIKIRTDWFHTCVNYFRENEMNMSTIILTWTNKQSDEYNNTIRSIISNNDKMKQYEVGDILILTDFYNVKETAIETEQIKPGKKAKPNNKRFYTSEQIKITDIEETTKVISEFVPNLTNRLKKIPNYSDVEDKYIKTLRLINKMTHRKYNVWKMYVQKLNEIIVDTIPETHQIYVIKNDSVEQLLADKKIVSDKIRDLRNYYKHTHKDHISVIDTDIIKSMWKTINKTLFETFANVNYGNSISCHKSQGSQFYNVFVDVEDILKNNREDEAKRCLYTAITRTANEVHLLI